MATFVLVHGAWHGAWCWARVEPGLRAAGHDVHTVTLTGLGDRYHLRGACAGLETHIDDVVAHLDWHQLEDVVLVGHSYGGMVITGVAERSAERIGRLVYLDAFVPEDGKSLFDYLSADFIPVLESALAQGPQRDGGSAPDPRAFGVADPADIEWVGRYIVPHPESCFDFPVSLTNNRAADLARSFVYCDDPAMGPFGQFAEKYQDDPAWRCHVLHTGHDAMVTDPAGVLSVLLEDADLR
ncbi:MAG: alpha/beta hydrolase [Rhodospirillales bacterium]|nr:alpha/beta hydrolase [Rhodospirillales bacterium]